VRLARLYLRASGAVQYLLISMYTIVVDKSNKKAGGVWITRYIATISRLPTVLEKEKGLIVRLDVDVYSRC